MSGRRLELAGGAARNENRQRVVIVLIAIAHAAAVEDRGMVQQIAVAIGRLLELVEKVRKHLDVIAVDQREFIHIGADVGVVRCAVEAIANTAAGVSRPAGIARVHQR